MNPLTTRSIFAPFLVCTTVPWVTCHKWAKFVDEVGSTVFYRNFCCEFATSRSITRADHPSNFTIFHGRMRAMQPAWPVCTTSVRWHTRCWHFCSCSSHKTIPPLEKWLVTQHRARVRCRVTALSIGVTQCVIMIARIGFKVKWQLQKDWNIKDNTFSFRIVSQQLCNNINFNFPWIYKCNQRLLLTNQSTRSILIIHTWW